MATVVISVADPPPTNEQRNETPTTLAKAFAECLRVLADRLRSDFVMVSDVEGREPAHDARLTTKRIRYILAPMQRENPGLKQVIRSCKRLQDLLGAKLV